ncbi:acetyltransferase, partial [Haloferax volcanii]
MNGPDTADETSFYFDYELQVDATRDAVAKLAREVLQYEW